MKSSLRWDSNIRLALACYHVPISAFKKKKSHLKNPLGENRKNHLITVLAKYIQIEPINNYHYVVDGSMINPKKFQVVIIKTGAKENK